MIWLRMPISLSCSARRSGDSFRSIILVDRGGIPPASDCENGRPLLVAFVEERAGAKCLLQIVERIQQPSTAALGSLLHFLGVWRGFRHAATASPIISATCRASGHR